MKLYIFLFLFLWGPSATGLSFLQIDSSSPKLNKALQTELFKMGREDQKYRTKWQSEIIKMSPAERIAPTNKASVLMKRQERIDKENVTRLAEIIRQHGWPGKSLVGERASQAAILILQHAELVQQEKYLLLLKAAASQGEVHPADAAMLEDRVLVGQGRKQRYGTQVHFEPETYGKWELYPIEDEERVDERRAAAGLEPLAEYLKAFGIEYKLTRKK